MESQASPVQTPVATEDKTVAIVAYLTLIGFIIALIMHSSNKTQIGAYHLRQSLGLMISFIVVWIGMMIVGMILAFIPVIGWITATLLWLAFAGAMIGLMVMGVIAAVNGQQKPLPLVGPLFAKWFAGAFV